MLHIIIVQHIH